MIKTLKLVAAALVFLLGIMSPTYAAAAATPLGVSTIAGTGALGTGGDNADATQSALYGPLGVAVDAAGNFYIADTGNHRIQKVDTTGAVTTIAGTGTSGLGGDNADATQSALKTPNSVSTDAAGNVYIADTGNHRIQKVDTTGAVSTIAGTGTSGLGGDNADATQSALKTPKSVSLDAAGNVYIADTGNNRVQKVDTTGAVTTIAGTGAAGTGGDNADATQSALNGPNGVAVDAAANVYIADTSNYRIQKIDTTGAVTTIAGTGLSGKGGDNADATQSALRWPRNVSVDTAGSIYIADTSNNRIQKVDTTGAVTTIAGTGTAGTGGDNADATQSALDYPYSLAIDTAGDLYIADTSNHRVQKAVFDTVDPTVSVVNPGDIVVGDTLTLNFSCADTAGSGIDTCAATLTGHADDTGNNGDTITATTRGNQSITVTATDNAGNTATETITFTVTSQRELLGDYKNATGPEGAIARLYMATFARNPENTGFAYWKTSHQTGTTFQQMANYFSTSPEFAARYGTTTNTDFVELMYANVMVRTAETEGHTYWLTQLDAGMSRARMLLLFSESPEFKQITYSN